MRFYVNDEEPLAGHVLLKAGIIVIGDIIYSWELLKRHWRVFAGYMLRSCAEKWKDFQGVGVKNCVIDFNALGNFVCKRSSRPKFVCIEFLH